MSEQISKKDLVKIVAEATSNTQIVSELLINSFLDAVRDSLKAKKKIVIQGFGTFKVSDRPARKGRNPRTGEEITIEAKTVVKFASGTKLTEAVN
jgi:nucleoid DNA-binding protein